MYVERKILYSVWGLVVCVFLFSCTKVSFEDPFTGENALAVPVISLIGPNPYKVNVNDAYYEPGATAIDTCEGDTTDITDSIEIKDGAISTDSPGEYTIKYYVRGLNGIRAKVEREVIVEEISGPDTEKPVITIMGLNPRILFIGETYTEEGATALDGVDGDLTGKIEIYGENITTDGLDSFEVWYMVSDNAGNIARKKRDVYVWEGGDRIPPELMLLGDQQISIYLYDEFIDPGATAWDEVDGDLTDDIVIIDSVNNTVQGIYPVRYQVSDKAGNATRKDRYVTVLNWPDTIPPVITLLGDSIMKLGAGGSFQDPGATAIDNVDGDISNRIKDSGSVNMQAVGSYYFFYNVSDQAGNEAEEKRRTITVVDTIGPTITINPPNPINLNVGTAYHEWGATAHDNLDGDITHKLDTVGFVDVNTNDSVNISIPGVYRVHYRVQDSVGYTTDSVRVVNVLDFIDTIPPVITLNPPNQMVLDIGDPYIEPGATAVDNKDGDITHKIVINSDTVNTSVGGTYKVHYTVSDSCGNSAHEIRPVFVGVNPDSTPPEITLSGSNPMYLAIGDPYNEPGATAVDDFDGDITTKIVINSDSVNTSVQGTYRVHYTVSDNAGNSAHEIRRVIVGATGDTVIVVDGDNNFMTMFPITKETVFRIPISQSDVLEIWITGGTVTIYINNQYEGGFSGLFDFIVSPYNGYVWVRAETTASRNLMFRW